MNLTLVSTKSNPLFKRREVEFSLEETSTPSRSKVRRELAVAFKADLNQVYVRRIETKSGTRFTTGVAHVYEDPEVALRVEPKYIVERNASPIQESLEEE